jgi:hypothetical protein
VSSSVAHESIQNVSDIFPPSCRLFVVGESKRSGLILCKSHYAEFAGPGAAIACPIEQGYESVLALGSPEIVEVSTYGDRQKAYSRRIQWLRWVNKIVAHPDPIQRTEKLFTGFKEFFGEQLLADIPNDVMALLAGVLPQTITQVRSQNPPHTPTPHSEQDSPSRIKILDWRTLQPAIAQPLVPVRATLAADRTVLPFSA